MPSIEDLLGVLGPTLPAAASTEPVLGRPPSAVLLPIYEGDAGPELILTRRAWHMRSHTGEMAFPGGRRDLADVDLVETALRETEEEIGVDRSLVEIQGVLEQHITVSSPAPILPIVGLLERRPEVTPSPEEVDGVLFMPIAELFDPAIYREEIWQREGGDFEITFFELVGDTLWGATARMLRSWFEYLA